MFRLQTVLQHRERLQEVAQQEHAQAQVVQVREEGSLRQLVEAESSAVDQLERQRFTGRLDIDALQIGISYLDMLKVQIQRQEQIVERVSQHTEQKREQVVQRMQERKILDRMRQHQLAAHTANEHRREAIEVDELVVMRHPRRSDPWVAEGEVLR
jgi:flagellar protein FliJ